MGLPKNNHSRHIRLLIVAWQRQFLFHILRMHQTDRSIRGRNGWQCCYVTFQLATPDMSTAVFNFEILQCQISCRKISGLQHFCWGWQQSISENCQQIPNSFLYFVKIITIDEQKSRSIFSHVQSVSFKSKANLSSWFLLSWNSETFDFF